MTKKIILSAVLAFTISGIAMGGNVLVIKKDKLDLEQNLFAKKKRRHSSSSDKVFGIGAQVSILKLLAGNSTLVGFGINALFSPNGEKNAFFADFNYYLSGTKTTEGSANALSSATIPQYVNFTINNKISGIGFRVGFRRYIINDISEDGFKMYGQAAIGVLLFKGKSTADQSFDPTLYNRSFEPSSTATGFTIGLGVGAEYTIASKVGIFAEANINLPANHVNGEEVEVSIPVSVQPVIGLRINL